MVSSFKNKVERNRRKVQIRFVRPYLFRAKLYSDPAGEKSILIFFGGLGKNGKKLCSNFKGHNKTEYLHCTSLNKLYIILEYKTRGGYTI